MKRQTNLLQQIAGRDNLFLAFTKARRGKTRKPDVLRYEADLDNNLAELRNDLLAANIRAGYYHFFTIYDPKVRLICAAPFSERVMHHAMMNICNHRFEQHLTGDTYATRKGKGTYAALDKAAKHTQKFGWYVKLDIRKYFDNIQHSILKAQLLALFNDGKLLQIFCRIIDSYKTAPGKGLPIGNLTSQYFANHYLSNADHFLREQLKVEGYIRYMDDMLLFGDDKPQLLKLAAEFSEYIESNLLLQLKPLVHHRTSEGVPFLGYKLFPQSIKLNKNSKRRFVKKLTRYESNLQSGKWSEHEYREHAEPLVAFTQYADATGFRKKVLYKF